MSSQRLIVAVFVALVVAACQQREAAVVTLQPPVPSPTAVSIAAQPSQSPPPAPRAKAPPARSVPTFSTPAAARAPRTPEATSLVASPPTPATPACGYVGGFAVLVDMLGRDLVGDCLENERASRRGGNAEQRTTRGLLVWDPDTSLTAFTDGGTTWYRCAYGIEQRPSWEPFRCTRPAVPGTAVDFVLVSGGPPGGAASVTVQTAPGAGCSLRFAMSVGTAARTEFSDGLKTADRNGRVSWSWSIPANTPSGTGTVTVACNGARESTSIRID